MSRAAWLALLFSVLVAAAVWYGVARPRTLAVEWHGPLKSASFAPFRDGQSPLEEIFPSVQQIEEDLLRLKAVFEGLRTYSVTGGMDAVPALAAKHGFALTLGAWLGRGSRANERELKALIATANRYPDAVKRVIVGNEVLLRSLMAQLEERDGRISLLERRSQEDVQRSEVARQGYDARMQQMTEELMQLRAEHSVVRREIEALLGTRVHLELWVKLEPRWARQPKRLKSLGYS